jgi:hypothetical protein
VVGFGHIDDDALRPVAGRIGLLGNGGESAKEKIADIGEDGGTSSSDAVLGKKAEEIGEDLVEVGGGLEFGKLAEEGDG